MIHSCTTIRKLNQIRSLSLSATRHGMKRKNNCEEVDCCGNPINVPPKPKFVMEKSCQPCCFYTWRPKLPILKPPPPLRDGTEKPFKKQHCYAGMELVNRLDAIKRAKECQKSCDPFNPVCIRPPPPKPVVKVECPLNIPEADWDINGNPRKELCECVKL